MNLPSNQYQTNSSWNAPYTFSGKEKDPEIGYGYFCTRYYDSGLSIWLSVHPMSDKYPSMSPYNYCANNPVILVDPDGMCFDEASQEIINGLLNGINFDKFKLQLEIDEYKKANNGQESPELNSKMKELSDIEAEIHILERSNQPYTIIIDPSKVDSRADGQTTLNTTTGVIEITLRTDRNNSTLFHELKHCFQFENKQISFSNSGGNGLLYDLTDEVEGNKRGSIFPGGELYTPQEIQKKYDDRGIFLVNQDRRVGTYGITPEVLRERGNYFKQD